MFSIIFRGSMEIFHVFFRGFQASTGKKLWGKNRRRNHETHKFDAKHSATDWAVFYQLWLSVAGL